MRTLMLSGVAALAMAASPAFAQSTSNPSNTMPNTTGTTMPQSTTDGTMQDMDQPDTTGSMDGEAYSMSTSQRGMYDTWPADRQAAYDNLDMPSQEYYWTLTPEQTRAWWVLTSDQQARIMAMTPQQRTAAWTSIAAQMNGTPTANAQGMANGSASTTGMANSSTTGSMSSGSTTGMANSSTTGSMSSGSTTGMANSSSTGSMSGTMAGSSASGSMASNTGTTASTNMGNMRFVRNEVAQATPGAAAPKSEYPPCRGDMQDSCVNPREAGLNYGNRPLQQYPGDATDPQN